jgi:uncharacterized protein (UPF0261 family)
MGKTVVVLATLDTKGQECEFLQQQIEALGGQALLMDLGILGKATTPAGITRDEVAAAGGSSLQKILQNPSRQTAAPIMIKGATKLLTKLVADGSEHAVMGLGGTQGTTSCTQIMQALPYGFPKVMLSTLASGDTSAFVDIKDITMQFSVGDILGLNPFTRMILANAAGAAYGMALTEVPLEERRSSEKPLIGMTNLGVLTEGAMLALDEFKEAGYEVIVFHAVGSGGRAMEQMMREGIIGAVFDYALGEIADEMFQGLRAGSPDRLTIAGQLGLPQVLCPGGAEHIGLIVEPDTLPERFKDHLHTFHSPIILAPRLNADELTVVGKEIGKRLQSTKDQAYMMLPLKGTSRYGIEGSPLHDPAGDQAFFDAIKSGLPDNIEVLERDMHAEEPAFVKEAVERLVSLLEARTA